MKYVFAIVLLVGARGVTASQEIQRARTSEISVGLSMLIYQSVYALESSTALELAWKNPMPGFWSWQVGARLGVTPALPEAYVRILAEPDLGSWQPAAGVELGYTNRDRFSAGDLLLRETRAAMEGQRSHLYIAGHAAPASFRLWNDWRVSVLELQIGTHLRNAGRTMRVQVGVIAVGKAI